MNCDKDRESKSFILSLLRVQACGTFTAIAPYPFLLLSARPPLLEPDSIPDLNLTVPLEVVTNFPFRSFKISCISRFLFMVEYL